MILRIGQLQYTLEINQDGIAVAKLGVDVVGQFDYNSQKGWACISTWASCTCGCRDKLLQHISREHPEGPPQQAAA
jgi:hypothetical protein